MKASLRKVIPDRRLDGKYPFAQWFTSLRNLRSVKNVTLRIRQVKQGNLGEYKSVGRDVCKLRIVDYSPT